MKDNYRWLTPVYGSLSSLVFGQTLRKSKTCFLSNILNKHLLIIGGGTGSDYQSVQRDMKGDFVEVSVSMLRKAKKNLKGSELNFHLGDIPQDKDYDLILLPFVLDTLIDEQLEELLMKIKAVSKQGALIYLSDFFPQKNSLNKLLQSLMIRFFRAFTKHPRKNLPDYKEFLEKSGFSLLKEKSWSEGWIRAQLWEKA
ncbi:Methyltransferase domain-containing protein [Algoriphagus ornithinivorans]|uniref:Methyltransferase domain-containing protein n=1 Tax=Algoriphagus ornithinivorans TaxID=226506 RepID=A0A1I5F4N4_9BACT|nr:class I SAM-dependent methyltransferase [Algoriphagus ornithinivorans]SFO18684.1 Methyltransferase domain-containing protein [Algoriphagus ornithinivorans]